MITICDENLVIQGSKHHQYDNENPVESVGEYDTLQGSTRGIYVCIYIYMYI
jgi:hypothetical protein